ncbi:MAG: hypothetical protein JXQ29_13050, partial [Planctomycetes bacterium]|nr:hypothetical protein [Planctomycetota bacterium]
MNPWALIGLLCAAAPAVEVALRSPVPGATAAMPCRFGVVLPPGWAAETRDIRAAEGDAGRPIAVDWTPVARWPGGTLRWVRGRASLEFRSGQARRLLLRPEPGGVARDGTSGGRLVLRTDDRFHEIREEEGSRPAARSLRACLGGGPLLWELRGGGLTWFAAGAGPELAWRREDGGRIAGTLEDVRPEGASSGCSIGLTARGAAGNGGLFRTRAEVWSGSFLLELEAAIESWPLEATAVGWEFGWPAPLTELAFRSARTRRISRRKCGQMRLVVAEGGAAELSADGRALGGDGPEATTLGLGFGSAWVVLDLGDAAVRGGVEVRAERGGVSVVLRQNVESFKADRRLTLRVVFGFANGPPPAALWNAVRAAGGYGGGVAVLRADAVDRWGGLGTWRAAAASAAAEDAIRESVALAVAEMGRPESMGADDFGDYRLPTLGWANAEYDAIRVLAQCHFRTQDPELLAWTRRAVRHHLDVDLDFKHTGLPRVHGTDHDGGHELGHTWIRGLLAHALLRGDAAALEAARGIARGIVSWVEGTRGALRLER